MSHSVKIIKQKTLSIRVEVFIMRLPAHLQFFHVAFVTHSKHTMQSTFLSDDVIPMMSSVNVGKRKSDGIFSVTM